MIATAIALLLTRPQSGGLTDRVRHALTVKGAHWSQVDLVGIADNYGVPHTYELTFDDKGRFVQKYTGPLGEAYGSDGKIVWKVDRSGAPQVLDFQDRDRVFALSLLLTSRWLDQSSEAGPNTLDLQIAGSPFKATILIDPKTDLPLEAQLPVSSGALKVGFAGWRIAGDSRLPTQVTLSEQGQADAIKVTILARSSSAPNYGLPTWLPKDTTFDSALSSEVEAKKAFTGHILVHPRINGQDVGWFILDSGAEVTVLDKSTADQLKLPKLGSQPLTGIGGTTMVSSRTVQDFQFGPLDVKGLSFTEYDLAPIGSALRIKLAGVIGAEFFRRSVVMIDMENGKVSLFNRDTFKREDVSWTPLKFDNGNPLVKATIEGDHTGWFRIDTGADGLTVHSFFVRNWNLLAGRKTTAGRVGGVGGTVATQNGELDWIDFAGRRFAKPATTFATGTTGAFDSPYLVGNIGASLLKSFRLFFDYTGNRVAFANP